MPSRVLMVAATLIVAVGSLALGGTTHAAVGTPAAVMSDVARAVALTDPVRRICRPVFRCGRFPRGCWWERSCHVTRDYPPEHGRR